MSLGGGPQNSTLEVAIYQSVFFELNFNKEKLIDIAFKTAFEELMLKINISYNIKRTKYINPNIIKSLINSFILADKIYKNRMRYKIASP